MAGRACAAKTESDPDTSSPAPKKRREKLSESEPEGEKRRNGAEERVEERAEEDERVKKSAPELNLESSEVLPSSDESFCEEEDKGRIRIGREPARPPAVAAPSEAPLEDQELGMQQNSLIGEHAHYQDLSLIGDGAYGTVYKAKDTSTGQIVALKRVRVPVTEDGLPTSTLREIAALKQLERFEHPQIVKLLDVCQGNYGSSERIDRGLTLWLVFEHVERDLSSFVTACQSRRMADELIKQMSREILLGVDFLHSHRIIHRDLKPQNLLVTKDGHVKIADFGLAKTYDFEMRLTSVVVTLWYRAPEVLLGCTYATPIDIWSVGCILAEINELRPLFPGTSEGDQLDKIFRIIGTPLEKEWPDNVSLGWSAFPFRIAKPIKSVLPFLCDSGRDLVRSMLLFNPLDRITAAQALNHPYFAEEDSVLRPAGNLQSSP